MIRTICVSLLTCAFAVVGAGCSSHDLLPHTKPLFAGIDMSRVPAGSPNRLAKAKTDFQCARAGGVPCHARDAGRIPHSQSRRFEGDGYEITLVDSWSGFIHRKGPKITLDSSLTGGKPYSYEEIEVTDD